ncbi:MAG: helix-turn-helix domain-containing protein [Ruminiclostridium sp.]|nr:helix-turn-helix domain-containing protein [Ruminiclostridium sp.]
MDSIAVTFGQRVRSIRKQRGLSQERLSEMCDLHPTYIGQIERGEKNASLETIMRICRGLNVSPSELFKNMSADGEKNTAETIYELILEMPAREQKAVLDIVKSIKNIIG